MESNDFQHTKSGTRAGTQTKLGVMKQKKEVLKVGLLRTISQQFYFKTKARADKNNLLIKLSTVARHPLIVDTHMLANGEVQKAHKKVLVGRDLTQAIAHLTLLIEQFALSQNKTRPFAFFILLVTKQMLHTLTFHIVFGKMTQHSGNRRAGKIRQPIGIGRHQCIGGDISLTSA